MTEQRVTKTKLYWVWHGMISRCKYPSNVAYKNYGGKGISVCPDWRDFKKFRSWAESHGYSEGLTIDRIDSDGNYCPENCRWADRFTQNNNTSRNRYIEFDGRNMTISQWARELGIARNTLTERLKTYPVEVALTAYGSHRGRTL